MERRLGLAGELDGSCYSGVEKKQGSCEPPVDPHLPQAVGGKWLACPEIERNELPAGLRWVTAEDEEPDGP